MKKISKILILFGIVLLLLAIELLINNYYEDYNAGKSSSEILSKLENTKKSDVKNEDNKKIVMLDGYNYIGTIRIDSFDLELPIMDSFDYNRLKKSPCLYYGSFETNDAVICSHGYKSHFGNINKLEPEDKITITDVNGNIYYYEVVLVEELEQTNISQMLESEFDLTLFTCTKDGINRVTVRCNRLS